MSPDPGNSCLGMEYFCFEGDELWNSSDADLQVMARRELDRLGLVSSARVLDGYVIRVPKAYPVYDDSYKRGIAAVREFLQTVTNLQTAGRNGMHRYNNQDHSMLTALLAARNILGAKVDFWDLHTESDYLEEGDGLTEEEIHLLDEMQPKVPEAY